MSDLFGGQAARLLREEAWTAQALAEEVYSILMSNPQLTPEKPILSTLGKDEPFAIIRSGDGNPAVFNFNRPDGTAAAQPARMNDFKPTEPG